MGEKLLLSKEEHLPAIGLSLIGIGLPQEYALRVYRLIGLAKEKGLGNITTDDAVTIVHECAEEFARREKAAEMEKRTVNID